jgi:phytoene dehydrogenase-like protein
LRRFESDPRLRAEAQRARTFVEGFEAADPALASARSIADELRSGVDSTSSRPVGSYAPLFAHLAARCAHAGVDVRLNAAVERIAWQRGGVTIGLHSAAELRARCAILTLPVGVLRRPHGRRAARVCPAASGGKARRAATASRWGTPCA